MSVNQQNGLEQKSDTAVLEHADPLYREHILDHFRNPRNFGHLTSCSIQHKETNPLCGDEVEIMINIADDTQRITDIRFHGQGCAISMAAASLLTEELQGKTLQEAKNTTPEKMLELLGIEVGIVRRKCALLALKALQEGLAQYKSTEVRIWH